MAAPSVTFDGTRVSAAESETDGGTWDQWDSAKSPSQEPDFVYQFGASNASISNKVGTSEGGVELEATTAVDYAGGGAGGADRVVLLKTIATNFAVLNNVGATGMVHYIGSGTTTDRYNYYTHGADAYPIAGGWVFDLIDPNIAAYRDATDGTPDLNNVDYYAVSATFTATSKAENVAMDAIEYFDVGTGLTLIGGDGASADATFDDFVSFDEGTSSNRYGIVRTVEGIIYTLGFLTIGTATETDFTDTTGGTMVFPDSRFGPGTVGVRWDIQNANSVMQTTGWSFVGRGSTTDADSRPDYVVTGAGASASATFDGCAWRNFRNWTMVVGSTFNNCVFADGDLITHGTATIDGCTFSGATTADGEAYLTTTDTDNISNSTFNFSDGHAIVITDNTASPMNIDNLTFVGYGANDTNDAAIYNNSGGAITLESINGSSGITVRNGTGASTTVNDSVTVSVAGLTEGTSTKIIANETVGTVTIGDVLATGFANASGVFTYSQNYEGAFDPSGLDVIVRARNAGIASACIANDGGAFTDETSEGHSQTTADMTLLPATPAANDAYHFGHQEQFTRLKLDISTALAFSAQPTIQWQYWNGTIWTALSGVVDGTSGFENAGENIVSWTLPGNWATRTDNSQGPFYYVRAQLTVLGTITTVPVGRKVTLDVTRYLPYFAERTIESGTGLSDNANWVVDAIGKFSQT